ncbi:diguanylate cyclase [Arenimonas sp.]|uniref:GGDEF domain-containing protein n=1 Tax=Arenimonas sp. TaxID=1872635 RepID=UPI0039E337D0
MAGESGADALRQLATVNRIARIALQDLALQPMLQRIVDTLVAEFEWEFVACATIDHEANEFVCAAVAGDLESEVRIGYRRALGTGVVGRCAATGETVDIDDARGHSAVIDTLHGTGSELCVPVLHQGEVLAVLNAESRRVGAFRGQRALLETVADQVAGILRAAGLYEKLRQANEELREAYSAVERLSHNDGLTGIANRRRFDAWLPEAVRKAIAQDEALSLLLLDVDHFKAFNDGYGHQAGDHCLQQVVAVLDYMLEGTAARLARYGGEEFVAILSDCDLPTALSIAERLRLAIAARAIEHRFAPGGFVTISIGAAACAPGAPMEADGLVREADIALYAAKRNGRNKVMAAR